jgi:7-carboxy-7-deazaguanine synthase
MTPADINQVLLDLPPSPWITLSGGDPVMYDLKPLVRLLNVNFNIAVETEGFLYRDFLEECELVTVSPKPPSSGMDLKFRPDVMERYSKLENCVMKIVVFDRTDLSWAIDMHKQYPHMIFFLSSGTPMNVKEADFAVLGIAQSMRNLWEDALKVDELCDAIILPQLHALAWPHEKER